jgi:hypothetical protein
MARPASSPPPQENLLALPPPKLQVVDEAFKPVAFIDNDETDTQARSHLLRGGRAGGAGGAPASRESCRALGACVAVRVLLLNPQP